MRFKTLTNIDIVWTRIDSNLIPNFLEHLENHLGSTSLPICSCDMYGFEALLGMAKILSGKTNLFESIIIGSLRVEKFF